MEQQLPLFARELALADQQTVWKALSLLECQLRETGASFTSSHAVRDWLRLQLASLEREEFTALFLDNQHRLIAHETLFTGTINHTQVHPREVVKAGLKHNCAAVIVAHSHPSGEAEPSKADRQVTTRIQQALDLVAGPPGGRRHGDHLVCRSWLAVAQQENNPMKIISKRQAMAIYRQYPQSRLFPFCTGKYKWSGSICHYAGQEVQDISGVLAVFAERRQSRNGPYVVLRSVTLN